MFEPAKSPASSGENAKSCQAAMPGKEVCCQAAVPEVVPMLESAENLAVNGENIKSCQAAIP